MIHLRAVLLISAATLTVQPLGAEAVRRHPAAADRSAFAYYVHARAADDLGELDVAAAGYAAALAGNPGDTKLALRAMRQAVAAGDMPLATKMARQLDDAKSLPPDGVLLLTGEAVSKKDWKAARALTDRLEEEKLFAFLAPTVRAWIAYGSHDGDPVALLSAQTLTGLSATYAAEHRALLLIATGKASEGTAAIAALSPEGARAARLRIAAAATLAQHQERAAAIALLAGDDPATVRARGLLQAGRKLPGAINSAGAGIGELLVRVAADINREQAGALALEFARVATTLAPDDSETWLVTASLLGTGGDYQAGLDALANITLDDPFVGAGRDARLGLLVRSGKTDQALTEAKAATDAKDATAADYARYADLLVGAGRNSDGAIAYGRAIDLAGGDKAPSEVAWPLLLQQANALHEAGDWPSAKKAAEHALALAPQEPSVLNFLGYSELEHGEDVTAAAAMIAKASQFAPDDPSITDSLGWSWYVRGDLEKAIPLLEQAAKGAPAETDINEHLGDAYWKAGRKLEARYAWRAALVAADDSEAKRLHAKIDFGPSATP